MKKLTTFLCTLALLFGVVGGVTTVKADDPFDITVATGFGDEITSLKYITDGNRFAIGDGTNAMYWVTSTVDNQKSVVTSVPSDAYFYYVLEQVDGLDTDGDEVPENDNYKIKIINASGAAYTHAWNLGSYLNYSKWGHLFAGSGKSKAEGGTYDYGGDGDYYAIWKVAYSDGYGFTLKNAGTNKYAKVAGSSDAVTYLKLYKSIEFTTTTVYPADDDIFDLSKATGYDAETGEMTNGTWTFATPVDLSNWKYIIIAMENACSDPAADHLITIKDNMEVTVSGDGYNGEDAGTGQNMWFSRWHHQNIGAINLDYLKNTKGVDINHITSLSISGTTKPFAVYLSSYENTKLVNIGRWDLYKAGDLVREYSATGKFGTVCLPYKASVAGAEVYSIEGKTASSIALTKVNGLLEAGKPYFYMSADENGQNNEESVRNVNFFRADFDNYDAATPVESNGLIGTFSEITAPDGSNYYILSGNKLYDTEGCTGSNAVTIGANKAYINLDDVPAVSSAREAFILFDEPTGIDAVQEQVTVKQATGIYNLSGQRLNQLRKGLNIVDGKKVWVY